jgi:hypothetical protein
MSTNVIGFSGKKQSGKNTAANLILGTVMKNLGYVKGFKITSKGELYIFDLLEDVSQAGVFDITENSQRINSFREKWLDNHIKIYSFADSLKQDICINILGLSYEQCYGTDEQKNSATHLRWEDMPGITTNVFWSGVEGLQFHTEGVMTAREVMQFVGTELFRKMYNNVWVDATMRKIKEDRPKLALICDVRFPNEADGVNSLKFMSDYCAYGHLIRLLRDPNAGQDQHESETALDNYPEDRYYKIIDNRNMSITEQCDEVLSVYTNIIGHNDSN